MNNKILVLGDGLLGSEIVKKSGWDYISRKKNNIDFNNILQYTRYFKTYDQIINCIGSTDTYSLDREHHWKTNYLALMDLVDWCDIDNKKLIHISTDYIYAGSKQYASEKDIPVHARNWYSYTKLLADAYVQARSRDYLLVRTSFKPRPFPYEKAVIQFGNFDYVDVIAGLIIKLINKNATGVYNVGTDVKSMRNLAAISNPNISSTDIKIDPSMPIDVTMNINKMREFLND